MKQKIGTSELEVKDNSDSFLSALPAVRAMALEAIGMKAEGYAKAICPVDTGRLRASISHARDDSAAYIGTNVEYAPYVELGADGRKPKPFLRPAAQDHREEYKEIVKKALEG